jgi:predicted metal-binding transcription factor (methanogenesis marker protein 9)
VSKSAEMPKLKEKFREYLKIKKQLVEGIVENWDLAKKSQRIFSR